MPAKQASATPTVTLTAAAQRRAQRRAQRLLGRALDLLAADMPVAPDTIRPRAFRFPLAAR